ncbi:MAG: hypothetical protein ACI857_002129, partial [Arenicella sp.]
CNKEEVKVGNEYSYDGLTVKFKDYGDSRCPSDVQCVSAGLAVGYFEADLEGETEVFEIAVPGADTIFNYEVRLHDIYPYPTSKNSGKKREAKLTITKL